ncbi:hypothetical protein PoB_001898200 [Plakobranchus ocellatus]|uniref:Uncharacterized protein n=1 Tax=Plakobranchus ocellatus TaxID=259542 RepID=A0AAV3ZB44_9GAST|nr:hypothetical protein PoB_001898200 [Plakobranchus ocellatus]
MASLDNSFRMESERTSSSQSYCHTLCESEANSSYEIEADPSLIPGKVPPAAKLASTTSDFGRERGAVQSKEPCVPIDRNYEIEHKEAKETKSKDVSRVTKRCNRRLKQRSGHKNKRVRHRSATHRSQTVESGPVAKTQPRYDSPLGHEREPKLNTRVNHNEPTEHAKRPKSSPTVTLKTLLDKSKIKTTGENKRKNVIFSPPFNTSGDLNLVGTKVEIRKRPAEGQQAYHHLSKEADTKAIAGHQVLVVDYTCGNADPERGQSIFESRYKRKARKKIRGPVLKVFKYNLSGHRENAIVIGRGSRNVSVKVLKKKSQDETQSRRRRRKVNTNQQRSIARSPAAITRLWRLVDNTARLREKAKLAKTPLAKQISLPDTQSNLISQAMKGSPSILDKIVKPWKSTSSLPSAAEARMEDVREGCAVSSLKTTRLRSVEHAEHTDKKSLSQVVENSRIESTDCEVPSCCDFHGCRLPESFPKREHRILNDLQDSTMNMSIEAKNTQLHLTSPRTDLGPIKTKHFTAAENPHFSSLEAWSLNTPTQQSINDLRRHNRRRVKENQTKLSTLGCVPKKTSNSQVMASDMCAKTTNECEQAISRTRVLKDCVPVATTPATEPRPVETLPPALTSKTKSPGGGANRRKPRKTLTQSIVSKEISPRKPSHVQAGCPEGQRESLPRGGMCEAFNQTNKMLPEDDANSSVLKANEKSPNLGGAKDFVSASDSQLKKPTLWRKLSPELPKDTNLPDCGVSLISVSLSTPSESKDSSSVGFDKFLKDEELQPRGIPVERFGSFLFKPFRKTVIFHGL